MIQISVAWILAGDFKKQGVVYYDFYNKEELKNWLIKSFNRKKLCSGNLAVTFCGFSWFSEWRCPLFAVFSR